MKLVVDIPENYYNDLMSLKLNDGEHLSYEMEMIRNGKRLSAYMKTLRLRILHDFYNVKPKYWYTSCTQIEKSIKEFMDNDYKYEKKEVSE